MRRTGRAMLLLMVGLFPTNGRAGGGDDARAGRPEAVGISAERLAAIVAEFDASIRHAEEEGEKGRTEDEQRKIYLANHPDVTAYSRRVNDLVAADPTNPAARDGLIWVLDTTRGDLGGPKIDEFQRAVLLALRHHPDDPEVARIGLDLQNMVTVATDEFLNGLYVRARNHEARGLARMALVQYLVQKAEHADFARKQADPFRTEVETESRGDDGKLVRGTYKLPEEYQAYEYHLRVVDPAALRAEARRLADEVIREYADVPYVTRRTRNLEAAMRLPEPAMRGHVFTQDERNEVAKVLAHKQSLADRARGAIDELDNVVVGRPAPAIEGPTMDGQPRRLADYRGKVVVLVFWGTWCGPCMGEVPNERELAERLKDKPFALLGVDCEDGQDRAREVMARERMTWPNWNDGAPGTGPIAAAYHIKGYPTSFVVDAQGIIRHIGLRGSGLGAAVDALLGEMVAEPTPPAH